MYLILVKLKWKKKGVGNTIKQSPWKWHVVWKKTFKVPNLIISNIWCWSPVNIRKQVGSWVFSVIVCTCTHAPASVTDTVPPCPVTTTSLPSSHHPEARRGFPLHYCSHRGWRGKKDRPVRDEIKRAEWTHTHFSWHLSLPFFSSPSYLSSHLKEWAPVLWYSVSLSFLF